jgi:hypothetical protein
MNPKKFGGEDFGHTLADLKAMAPHAQTVDGVKFEGNAKKVSAILILAGLSGELIAEIERLQGELQVANIDQEIAQFARDTTVMPELASALDPFLEPIAGKFEDPSTAEEWYETMKLMLDAAKASGLWPIKPEPELTDEAQADRDEFVSMSDERGCSCHISPPCGYCTHPGNPANQEDPSCWKVAP